MPKAGGFDREHINMKQQTIQKEGNFPKDDVRYPNSSLLGISAISEHLKLIGYPETSLNSMLRCGEPQQLKDGTPVYITSQCDCQTQSYKLNYNCNLRVCPKCAQKRKRRLKRKYLPMLHSVKADRNRSNFKHLIISPENFGSYSYGYNKVREDLKKFMRTKFYKERVEGSLYVIEGKFSPEKGWNVHVHMTIFGKYLNNKIKAGEKDSELVKLWMQGSGKPVNIFIKALATREHTLNYMLKYVSVDKADFGTQEDRYIQVAEYIMGTRKKRLVNATGCFYNLKMVIEREICQACGGKIYYIFDIEVSFAINKNGEPPPDPPKNIDLLGFI